MHWLWRQYGSQAGKGNKARCDLKTAALNVAGSLQVALLAGVWLILQVLPLPPGTALAAVSSAAVALAPHRAVYEISLDRSGSGSGVRELKGRMVYELRGSACVGFTQNMRFVTRTVGSKGRASIADMRSTTWESGLAKRFRFNSSQYQDQKLLDEVRGGAKRRDSKDAVKVELSKPKQRNIELSANVFFPVQHSIALLEAAIAGKSLLQADLYDGTDNGDKVYATTSIIGSQLAASSDAGLPKVKNTQGLRDMKVWPISISYFKMNKQRQDGVPIYELAFRFYANGVSRRLFIDYGDFAVRGVLTDLKYFAASECPSDGTGSGSSGSDGVKK